jgi:hypothetical protein
MEHTNTYDNNFVVLLVLLMLLPLFIHFFMEIVRSLYSTAEDNTYYEQDIYESIKQTAISQAMQGNSSARTWVTKNVLEPQKKAKKIQKQSVQFLTDKKVMQDVLDGLVKIKYKKEDAKKVVIKLAKRSKYTDPGAMLIDCIKEL